MKVPWDPFTFDGVGPNTHAKCAIPLCGKDVDTKGLCNTCFQCWFRYGMEGLERRMNRIRLGEVRIKIPLDIDKALECLFEVYERYREEDDDLKWDSLRKKVIKICVAIGNTDRRKKGRRWTSTYNNKKIKELGYEEHRRIKNIEQRRYRAEKKLEKEVESKISSVLTSVA